MLSTSNETQALALSKFYNFMKIKLPILFLGNFTSPTDLNLILAKVNHIEVLSVTPEGLRPIKQFTINGRVEVMKFFRPQGLNKDRLFIVTAKNNAMILEADDSGNTLEIITKARGDVGDRIGQNAQTGTRAIIGKPRKTT